MFGNPSEYLAKTAEVLSIQLKPDLVATDVEMKASRDFLIHNGGLINQLYLDEAGRKLGAKSMKNSISTESFRGRSQERQNVIRRYPRETEQKYR